MAEIGATPAGGSNRQALTDEDRQGRALFRPGRRKPVARCTWTPSAICSPPDRDRIRDADPILIGSHLDTQPTGGRFDGVYGVLAGLEVVRTH